MLPMAQNMNQGAPFACSSVLHRCVVKVVSTKSLAVVEEAFLPSQTSGASRPVLRELQKERERETTANRKFFGPAMSLKQPVNQVRLTNVAVVRLKRKGKRFELACYKNKVMSWREGNEKDLDEVLQTPSIFSNVSKGILAKSKDLKDAFKTDDNDAMVLEILRKGELQVSERERQYQTENLFNEIAVIVSEKCVDPATKRPFSVGIIERAMRDTSHFAVQPNKPAKAQAKQVIQLLQEHMSISRAQMRLQLCIPSSKGKLLKEKLKPHVQAWEEEEWSSDFEATVLVDPGSFRAIEDLIREETRGQGTFEVLSLAVIDDNDEQLT